MISNRNYRPALQHLNSHAFMSTAAQLPLPAARSAYEQRSSDRVGLARLIDWLADRWHHLIGQPRESRLAVVIVQDKKALARGRRS